MTARRSGIFLPEAIDGHRGFVSCNRSEFLELSLGPARSTWERTLAFGCVRSVVPGGGSRRFTRRVASRPPRSLELGPPAVWLRVTAPAAAAAEQGGCGARVWRPLKRLPSESDLEASAISTVSSSVEKVVGCRDNPVVSRRTAPRARHTEGVRNGRKNGTRKD